MRIALLLLLVPLCGCANVKRELSPETQETVIKEVKTNRAEILASNNQTSNAMTGLITASVSKLGETVKGIEASIGQLIGDISVKLSARITGVDARFEDMIRLNTELKLKLDAQITLNTALDTKIDKLNSEMTAQVGLYNKIESRLENINAGRDVNYLPKEAVEVITSTYRFCYYLIIALLGLASTVISLAYRSSRQRADLRAREEREERRALMELLNAD